MKSTTCRRVTQKIILWFRNKFAKKTITFLSMKSYSWFGDVLFQCWSKSSVITWSMVATCFKKVKLYNRHMRFFLKKLKSSILIWTLFFVRGGGGWRKGRRISFKFWFFLDTDFLYWSEKHCQKIELKILLVPWYLKTPFQYIDIIKGKDWYEGSLRDPHSVYVFKCSQ